MESDDQLHPHRDLTPNAFDEAGEIGLDLTRRHAIDQADDAARLGELGFEHERGEAVSARHAENPDVGAMIQRPCSGVPKSDAKQAAESKCGRHSQSIDPSRPTSAAVCMSPIRA